MPQILRPRQLGVALRQEATLESGTLLPPPIDLHQGVTLWLLSCGRGRGLLVVPSPSAIPSRFGHLLLLRRWPLCLVPRPALPVALRSILRLIDLIGLRRWVLSILSLHLLLQQQLLKLLMLLLQLLLLLELLLARHVLLLLGHLLQELQLCLSCLKLLLQLHRLLRHPRLLGLGPHGPRNSGGRGPLEVCLAKETDHHRLYWLAHFHVQNHYSTHFMIPVYVMCSMYICRMYILVQTSYISCICMKIHVALALFFGLVRQNIKLSETPNHENKMRSGMDSFSLWIYPVGKASKFASLPLQTAVFHSPIPTPSQNYRPRKRSCIEMVGKPSMVDSPAWGGDVGMSLVRSWGFWSIHGGLGCYHWWRWDDDFMDFFLTPLPEKAFFWSREVPTFPSFQCPKPQKRWTISVAPRLNQLGNRM